MFLSLSVNSVVAVPNRGGRPGRSLVEYGCILRTYGTSASELERSAQLARSIRNILLLRLFLLIALMAPRISDHILELARQSLAP